MITKPAGQNTMRRDLYYTTCLVGSLLLGYVSTCTGQPYARCNCGGRCGSFNCPRPTTVYHCDCVNCRCLNRPGGTGLRNCYHNRCNPTTWKCPQYKECDMARCACAGDHLGLWGLHYGRAASLFETLANARQVITLTRYKTFRDNGLIKWISRCETVHAYTPNYFTWK